jgi:basic amino acid/polyamine antiporter, APA family
VAAEKASAPGSLDEREDTGLRRDLGLVDAGRLNTLVVLISLSVLVLFVVTGLPAIDRSNLRPFAAAGVSGILEAAGLLFFAYTGYARVATLGEEVQDPRKTIPKAIVSALAISSLLYLAVSYVAVGTIGAEEMGRTRSPLQQATFTRGTACRTSRSSLPGRSSWW